MKTTDQLNTIQSCLQGNADDFEALVKHYQSNVMALARNILGNRDDALDMVQETFVQSYLNLHRFDTTRNFKTWLLGIATKRCLDHLRKQKSILNYFKKKSDQIQREQHSHRSPAPHHCHPSNHGKFIPIEHSELFNPLLKKIKDKERIAVVLQVNEGYTAKEIGEVLGCKESTARVHLFNGKKNLKQLLAKQGITKQQPGSIGTIQNKTTGEVTQ